MKSIWCLFDGSGIMGLPWAEAGYQVYCFNSSKADHGLYEIRMEHPNIFYVDIWIDDTFNPDLPAPSFICGFPSCTEVAGSGAKHDRNSSGLQITVANAKLVESLGNKYSCPWLVENPVGLLSSAWRKPDMYIEPFHYGGYLLPEEGSFHLKMPVQDAYTKKTCIWVGNGFKWPDQKKVHHIGCFWGWKYLGGASQKTKQLRSLTPRGFARAVFLSHQ